MLPFRLRVLMAAVLALCGLAPVAAVALAATLRQEIPSFPTDMGPGALAALIVMFVASPVISFISRIIPPGEWESPAEALLTLIACAIMAALVLYANNAFTGKDLFLTFLVIFGGAITLYRFFYNPSGFAKALSGKS